MVRYNIKGNTNDFLNLSETPLLLDATSENSLGNFDGKLSMIIMILTVLFRRVVKVSLGFI